jgi:hypothetical protein
VGNQRMFPEGAAVHKREGGGDRLGLNPNAGPLYPAPEAAGLGQAGEPGQLGRGRPQDCHAVPSQARPQCHGSVL